MERGRSEKKNTSATLRRARKSPNRPYVQLDSKIENCWLCESWVECNFQINLVDLMEKNFDINFKMDEDLKHEYKVYMHFDFDKFDADEMDDMRRQTMNLKGIFRCNRMIPQGYFHYFFSYRHEVIDEKGKKSIAQTFTFVDDKV